MGANLENVGRPQLEASDTHTHTHTHTHAPKKQQSKITFLERIDLPYEMTKKIPLGEVDHPPWPKRAYQGRMNSAASLANMVIPSVLKSDVMQQLQGLSQNCSILVSKSSEKHQLHMRNRNTLDKSSCRDCAIPMGFSPLENSKKKHPGQHFGDFLPGINIQTKKKTTINKSEQ